MTYEEFLEGDVVVFALSGKIMAFEECLPLRNKLKGHIDQNRKYFVFDMAGVSWMNSEGVGLLASAVTTVGKAGGRLVLANIGDKVERVLTITKCNRIIKHFDDLKAAIAAVKPGESDSD